MSNLETAIYSSIFTIILGVIFYVRLWWDGNNLSWRFTRWFFVILAIIVGIVGICVYLMS
ncbi:hypothetical protein LYSBPC_31830 [Lysinibacillus piscis]|uniref:Uncharacterized protein n=1 Tax=Lysinibacillus piscis TaxID=2518931 RepID=A0ABQ5NNU7_9BACI|nr:hypothetical protein LYSBPC_31830 [Lysinibacillus sp. KH24]